MPDPSRVSSTSWSYLLPGDRLAATPVTPPTRPRYRRDRVWAVPDVALSRVWSRQATLAELAHLWHSHDPWEDAPYAQLYRPPSVYHRPVPDEEVELLPESLWARNESPGWVPMSGSEIFAAHNLLYGLPLPPAEMVADAIAHLGRAGNVNRRFGPEPARGQTELWRQKRPG